MKCRKGKFDQNQSWELRNDNEELQESIHTFIALQFQQIKLEIDCQTEFIYYDYNNTVYDREIDLELAIETRLKWMILSKKKSDNSSHLYVSLHYIILITL